MGCSFNSSLIEVMGDVVSTEQRAISSNPDELAEMCKAWKVTYPNTTRAGCPFDTGVNLWGPTLNIDRDPRWGRSAESPTEDPWWLSVYAQRFVQGVQQEHNPKGKGYLKAIASPKHFTAYTIDHGVDFQTPPDERMYWSRGNYSGEVSAFDMMDSYLRQWQGAIQAGGARGIMCSYDAPNGIPSCANAALQVELLQKQWGLAGPVVTDCGAIGLFYKLHNYTADAPHAIAAALHAGTSINCGDYFANEHGYLNISIDQGLTTAAMVDTAFKTAYRPLFEAGLFDPPESVPWTSTPLSDFGSDAHRHEAYEAALQSIVLLMNNDGLLPINPAGKSMAMVGPQSSNTGNGDICGGYTGPLCPKEGCRAFANGTADRGCYNQHHCLDTIFDVFNHSVSAANGTASLELGVATPKFTESVEDIPKALQLVQRSDWTVLAIGSDTSQEGEVRDRLNISLSDAQKALIKGVLATEKPVVVVVTSSAGLGIDIVKDMATGRKDTAVVDAGFLCDNQRALPDTILGKRNRLGKLAHTVYPEAFALHDLPIPTARECGCNFTAPMLPGQYEICTSCSKGFFNMSWRSSAGVSPGRSYRYYEKEPLWPFGWGLSLTRFTLAPTSPATLALASATPMQTESELRSVKLTVKNIGPLAGDEVVMAFFTAHKGSLQLPFDDVTGATLDVTVPKRQLFAARRVNLAVGEEVVVEFAYSPESFALVDEAGTRRVLAGRYSVEFTNGVDLSVNMSMSLTVNATSVITKLPSGWNTKA